MHLSKLQSQTVQSNSKWTCALLVLGMRRLNGIRQDPIGNFNKLQVMQIKGNACARYAGQIFRMGHFKRHSKPPSLLKLLNSEKQVHMIFRTLTRCNFLCLYATMNFRFTTLYFVGLSFSMLHCISLQGRAMSVG